tara:strand:+ start:1884 stop:2108 length:225 start_codon:yes stop_codon:yes gene_type:complete
MVVYLRALANTTQHKYSEESKQSYHTNEGTGGWSLVSALQQTIDFANLAEYPRKGIQNYRMFVENVDKLTSIIT